MTKDTPKFAALLLKADGTAQLVQAGDDEPSVTSAALHAYTNEYDTYSTDSPSGAVEPLWDMYMRTREYDKLRAVTTRLYELAHDLRAGDADDEEFESITADYNELIDPR